MSGGLTSHADCSINQHMIWFMEMTASGLIKYLNPHNDIQQKHFLGRLQVNTDNNKE